jgi:hypothetical protein
MYLGDLRILVIYRTLEERDTILYLNGFTVLIDISHRDSYLYQENLVSMQEKHNEGMARPDGLSGIFLFDFMERYAIDRCGASEGLVTSIASIICVLPTWIWMSSILLALAKVEIYWTLARYSVTLVTIVQIVMLFVFHMGPPVIGCGPSRSFPNAQVTISSFALSVFLCYGSMQQGANRYGRFVPAFMAVQLACVVQSVAWIGLASPSSIVAGCVTGTLPACLLHHALLYQRDKPDGCLMKFLRFIEARLGVHTMDTILDILNLSRASLSNMEEFDDTNDLCVSETVSSSSVVMGYIVEVTPH